MQTPIFSRIQLSFLTLSGVHPQKSITKKLNFCWGTRFIFKISAKIKFFENFEKFKYANGNVFWSTQCETVFLFLNDVPYPAASFNPSQ
jgi:hypothetical protein